MALVIAVALAILVLPTPWNLVAVIVGATWELTTLLGGAWWSQRRSIQVGAEALIGREVPVRETCAPEGRVSVRGELWRARCEVTAGAGDNVRIVGLDGLTLVVEPVVPAAATPAPAGLRGRAAS